MTKEQVVYFRDVVAKDKAVKIVCDNQHIFYDNITHYPPIIWDDEKELFMAVRVNQDPCSHVETPFETTVTSYEHIQFLHCYDSSADAIDMMNDYGVNLSDEKKASFKKYLSEASVNRKKVGQNYNYNNVMK